LRKKKKIFPLKAQKWQSNKKARETRVEVTSSKNMGDRRAGGNHRRRENLPIWVRRVEGKGVRNQEGSAIERKKKKKKKIRTSTRELDKLSSRKKPRTMTKKKKEGKGSLGKKACGRNEKGSPQNP